MLASRLASIFYVFALLTASPSLGQEPTSRHLEQLRAEADQIALEGSAMGGADTMSAALNNLRQRQFDLEEQNRRMVLLIEAAGGRVEDLEAYRQGEEARRIHDHADGIESIQEEVRDHVLQGIAEAIGEGAGRAVGVITLLLDVTENVALKVIKESDLTAFRQLIRDEKLRVGQLYALKYAIELDQLRTAERVRAVEAKREEFRHKMADIETELARIKDVAEAEAEAKDRAATSFRLSELAELLRDLDSDDDALMEKFARVETATGVTVEEIDWHLSAYGAVADRIYYCPPRRDWVGGTSVDGTDRYYEASQICHAAVHAGAITFDGGFVRLRLYPWDRQFRAVASTRFGIATEGYNWTGTEPATFSFVPVIQ